MHTITGSPDSRLMAWKEHRCVLSTLSKEDQLVETARFWSTVPMSARSHFSYHDANSKWANPWEMIHDGNFCKNMVSVLIAHSLIMVGTWKQNEITLFEIEDNILAEQRLVVKAGTNVLNFEIGKVTPQSELTDCSFLQVVQLNTI